VCCTNNPAGAFCVFGLIRCDTWTLVPSAGRGLRVARGPVLAAITASLNSSIGEVFSHVFGAVVATFVFMVCCFPFWRYEYFYPLFSSWVFFRASLVVLYRVCQCVLRSVPCISPLCVVVPCAVLVYVSYALGVSMRPYLARVDGCIVARGSLAVVFIFPSFRANKCKRLTFCGWVWD
jgi:hypothetical protein